MNIRLATMADCKELSKLKLEVWNTTYRGIYPEDKFTNYNFEMNEGKFKNLVEHPSIDLYVVEEGNRLIGYMDYGTPIRPFENYEQEIGLMYVLKDYQRQGIGKELFQLAAENMKQNGYHEFFVSCNKYNTPANCFYEAMGGKVIHIDEDEDDKSIPQITYLYQL